MLKSIPGLPAGVIGYSAIGKVTAEDYTRVMIPAIEAALAKGKVRFLYEIGPEFQGFEMGAMMDDAAFGIRHFFDFERVALVSETPRCARWCRASA